MKIYKPHFWKYKKSIISFLLLPLSSIIQILFFLRKMMIKKTYFSNSVICVGNLYLGGTGKTPLSLKLYQILKKLKKKPVIIKKFYHNQLDEINFLKKRKARLIVEKNRIIALNKSEKLNYDVNILDDGFQDPSISKDLNLICFNSSQLDGNGRTFPSGPLRESLNSIKSAQLIIINGSKNIYFEKKIKAINPRIKIFYSNYIPDNIKKFKNKKLLAFAGIGNPENFFELLKKHNLVIKEKFFFPDHYRFSKKEVKNLKTMAKQKGYALITTEKDYCRIYNLFNIKISYLSIKLKITEEKKFVQYINNFIK